MSLYTAKFAKNGAAITIPGLDFIPREGEGFLELHYNRAFDKTVVPQYDCGPYTATVYRDGATDRIIDMPNHFWGACAWLDLVPITPASIIRTPAQLIAAGVVPPFGDTGMPVTWPAEGSVSFLGPMKIATGMSGYEPKTGGRYDIGIATAWAAKWLSGKGNANNMLELAKVSPTMPIWFYDESTGKLIDLIAKPATSGYSGPQQGGAPNWLGPWPVNPNDIRPVPNPLPPFNASEPQTAHMMEGCGIVALATGEPRYVRTVQARVIRGFVEDNYFQGLFGGVTVFNREMRGTAWLLRELFFCYWATKLAEDAGNLPADCLASTVWKKIIDNQAAQFAKFIEPSPWFKAFGVWGDQQIAWWQCDMVNQVLGLYAGKWPAEWGHIYVKTFKNCAARVNADGKNQWPAALPNWYWGWVGANNVPFSGFPELWSKWSVGQAAGTDASGNNGWITPAQVAKLNADYRNGLTFINPSEYESWTFGAIAYAVFWDRGVGAGAMSAAYPRLEAAYSDYRAMMVKIGGPIPQCSLNVDAKPLDNTPLPMPPVIQPPVTPPPAPAPDPSPAPQPQPPATGGTMTTIVQGKGYILTPKITAPPGAIHYGVKPGSWTIDKPDQASIAPQGDAQATAKVTAIVDTTAEDIAIKCDVFVDAAKTKTIPISITLSDVLVEATAGGFDVIPAQS